MQLQTCTILQPHHKEEILQLWNQEYPKEMMLQSMANFDAYLEKLDKGKHWLLLNENNTVMGWAFSFDREGER